MQFDVIQEYDCTLDSVADGVFSLVHDYLRSSRGNWITLPHVHEYEIQIGHELVVQKGEITGSLVKRIKKYLDREYNVRLTEEELSEIGNIIARGTIKSRKYFYDFTKNINWNSGDFGDEDSCFWSSKSGARSMIEASNGFAMRLYEKNAPTLYDDREYRGYARCWVIPLVLNSKPALAIFNAYGRHLYLFAYILSEVMQQESSYVGMVNNGTPDGLLWINDGAGYLIGESVSNISSVDLMAPGEYVCVWCNDEVESEYDIHYSEDGEVYCEYCFNEHFGVCGDCFTHDLLDNMRYVEVRDYYVCEHCAGRFYGECEYSGWLYPLQELCSIEITFKMDSGFHDSIYSVARENVEDYIAEMPYFRVSAIKEITIDEDKVDFKVLRGDTIRLEDWS